MIEYSIVIPVYNEADKISSTIVQVLSFMRGFSDSFELIISDDGSTDNTASIVEDLTKENPELKIIRNLHRGKGPTVWSAFMQARGNYIYMADADLSAPISELKKLLVWAKEHDYDIVIASREGVGAERIGEPFYRHIMGRGFNLLVRLVALPNIQDTQCGFKLFKRECVRGVFPKLEGLKNAKELKRAYTGAWDVEVLLLAKKLGYTVKSVPVTWVYVKTTRISPVLDSLKMALEILQIKFKFLSGKYNSAQNTSGFSIGN